MCKPHPGIYRRLVSQMQAEPSAALLLSSNAFDIAGAAAAGLRTAWCKRQPSAMSDLGARPNHVIVGLADLAPLLPAAGRTQDSIDGIDRDRSPVRRARAGPLNSTRVGRLGRAAGSGWGNCSAGPVTRGLARELKVCTPNSYVKGQGTPNCFPASAGVDAP